jgi:hypothetical protein
LEEMLIVVSMLSVESIFFTPREKLEEVFSWIPDNWFSICSPIGFYSTLWSNIVVMLLNVFYQWEPSGWTMAYGCFGLFCIDLSIIFYFMLFEVKNAIFKIKLWKTKFGS